MENNSKMDSRVPIDQERVLQMLRQLPREAQVGILSSLSAMVAAYHPNNT